ncbi:50S ribosomal protein-like protein YmL27 [Trichodelitschia bisporula]|uniref:50S ribosomal protein-like protein YmL27 n=1 Tax=Trichodelitschia bisporula TaxID=703511 RepID=A0A6G1HXA8_9PEZI|nr:50S ribosomal protein-like protein YmL27 [Trichodelitschia bisporula]
MQPTAPLLRSIRRLQLTTKQAGKDYYKGTGSGSMGRHTKRGGYVVEYRKVRSYVCPAGLDKFELTPFVAKQIKTEKFTLPLDEEGNPDQRIQEEGGPKSGTLFLRRWKEVNGQY